MTGALVSVVIPARNEEGDIENCLAAVAAQDFPSDLLEVILVDGGSTDGTASASSDWLRRSDLPRWEVVAGPGPTPGNLNAGLRQAMGTFVCRVDARSQIPPNYISRCVRVMESDPNVVVVGGAQVARPNGGGAVEAGIARALNNRWATGMSRYRSGRPSGRADTVYLGFFRTDGLKAAGGWDERFPTNQDFELNRRLSTAGDVWFEAGIDVGYTPREDLASLFAQYRRFGRWKVRYWRLTGDRPRPRQLLLLAGPVLAAGPALWLTGRRPLRTLLAIGFGLGVVERLGSDGESAPILHRLVSVAGMCLVGVGWTGGVAEEVLRTYVIRPGPQPRDG